ncbi:unnamed protein product [Protopolystoma xenopodis]|uniref:Uncharacterized protein n=1 Tax=Protopolystoma xenopodis TaxID=117903 RepID=A0A3S4ZZI2_9PLAT|nr:unnamed protein product [Protopolystoma xenopodis]
MALLISGSRCLSTTCGTSQSSDNLSHHSRSLPSSSALAQGHNNHHHRRHHLDREQHQPRSYHTSTLSLSSSSTSMSSATSTSSFAFPPISTQTTSAFTYNPTTCTSTTCLPGLLPSEACSPGLCSYLPSAPPRYPFTTVSAPPNSRLVTPPPSGVSGRQQSLPPRPVPASNATGFTIAATSLVAGASLSTICPSQSLGHQQTGQLIEPSLRQQQMTPPSMVLHVENQSAHESALLPDLSPNATLSLAPTKGFANVGRCSRLAFSLIN